MYTKNFPEKNISIRDIIPLEKYIFLKALLVNSIIITSIEVLLEAPAEYNSL
jgi:hypothetical protein